MRLFRSIFKFINDPTARAVSLKERFTKFIPLNLNKETKSWLSKGIISETYDQYKR